MIIKLAERIIHIESLYPYTHDLCRDYMTEPADVSLKPDIDIMISEADIEFERIKSAREDEIEGRPARSFPDDYLESLVVYRKISEQMPEFDTFLFHGSAIAVDGKGYIFTASSGTGKSTHARLWRDLLKKRAVMINDDKPLIRVTEDRALVYGTPWDGKHGLSANISVPIKAVCILKRGKQNRIERIDAAEAMPMLIQQSYRPADPQAMTRTLTLIENMAGCVGLYRMECNMDPDAARMSYERMSI